MPQRFRLRRSLPQRRKNGRFGGWRSARGLCIRSTQLLDAFAARATGLQLAAFCFFVQKGVHPRAVSEPLALHPRGSRPGLLTGMFSSKPALSEPGYENFPNNWTARRISRYIVLAFHFIGVRIKDGEVPFCARKGCVIPGLA